jgi:hypothetical protein
MTRLHPAWPAEQQRRWLRPNAHLYWRPDAARFLPAHLHHLLPPELRPSPQDGYDRAWPNIAAWTGKRGRWTPERAARERAEQEYQEALERRQATAERLALCELKSAIAKLRSDLAFERFKRAAVRWVIAQHLLRKAGFRPDQPRWPAGSGRISGRWSAGAGTVAPTEGGADRTVGPTNPTLSSTRGGHHFVPREIFDNEPLRSETRTVFEQNVTGPLKGGLHQNSKEHYIYNKAVYEHYRRFLRDNGIRSEDMTADQARKFVEEIKRSTDPRVRDFNLKIYRQEFLYYLRRIPRRAE